ncbi:MAG: glycosyltransferase family 4 protein [Pyrinomonadaceae bacterium]
MKKRVLQFIGSFHQGGSESQAVALVKLLKNEGSFEVFAATLNKDGVLRKQIDGSGLPEIPEFPLTSFYNPNFVRQVRRCANYLRDNKIDLVHTHDFYTNVFGMAAAALAGVPVRISSKRETGGMRSGPQKLVEKIAFGCANAIVINSAAVREYLIGQDIPSSKIHVIYNGINIEQFTDKSENRTAVCDRYRLPTGENIRFITLVANLRHDVKNVPMLLRAAKRVNEILPNIHFVIAGEGALEMKLKETATQLDVADNVHFIGRCDEVPSLLSISSMCVLTSIAEGFSNSILEYMAAGKPVVATNVGGAPEAIIDGKTGFVVASDDDAALANRLMELLNDEHKAQEFGTEGKRIVEKKFSQDAQLETTIKLYNSLLQK